MSEPLHHTTHSIRQAFPDEAPVLTRLSFASKSYWNYPSEYFKRWENELTITGEYLLKNKVFVFDAGNTILAYYSLIKLDEDVLIGETVMEKGTWLEHMFVGPGSIGKGIGTKLFRHLVDYCRENSMEEVKILVDPHATGFYLKMGCEYIRECPSSIPGRTTPLMVFRISH